MNASITATRTGHRYNIFAITYRDTVVPSHASPGSAIWICAQQSITRDQRTDVLSLEISA